jgi:hypothetical protein
VSGPWSILIVVLLVGIPLASLIRFGLRELRDFRANADVRRRVALREEARKPAPGSVVVEGEIGPNASGLRAVYIVGRREFGCLGGPLLYQVPIFALQLSDGRCVSVEAGRDPTLLNALKLPSPAPPASPVLQTAVPMRPDLAGTMYELTGAVRVAGVFYQSESHLAPAPGRSATIEILQSRSVHRESPKSSLNDQDEISTT